MTLQSTPQEVAARLQQQITALQTEIITLQQQRRELTEYLHYDMQQSLEFFHYVTIFHGGNPPEYCSEHNRYYSAYRAAWQFYLRELGVLP